MSLRRDESMHVLSAMAPTMRLMGSGRLYSMRDDMAWVRMKLLLTSRSLCQRTRRKKGTVYVRRD